MEAGYDVPGASLTPLSPPALCSMPEWNQNQLIYLYSHSLFQVNLALVLVEGRKVVLMTYFRSGTLTFLCISHIV